MEYILENVPEYLEAQNTLNSKVTKWRSSLDKLSRFIEKSKTDLANERAILTNDLILEKEDEILLKQEELRRLESLYFGSSPGLLILRKRMLEEDFHHFLCFFFFPWSSPSDNFAAPSLDLEEVSFRLAYKIHTRSKSLVLGNVEESTKHKR